MPSHEIAIAWAYPTKDNLDNDITPNQQVVHIYVNDVEVITHTYNGATTRNYTVPNAGDYNIQVAFSLSTVGVQGPKSDPLVYTVVDLAPVQGAQPVVTQLD